MHDERAELERAIAEDPDNLDNYAVLADWLQAHEPADPRGQLIALMLAFEARPDDRLRLRREIELLFARHTESLLGALTPFAGASFEMPPLVWRAGFIQRIEVRSLPTLGELVATAFDHPSAAFVSDVVIAGDSRNDITRAIDALTKTTRPALRAVTIEAAHTLGFLDPLWTTAPRLTSLRVEVNGFDTRGIALPHVEHLAWKVAFSPTALLAVTTAPMPRVKSLRIMFTGVAPRLDDLAPLFTRKDLPELRYLALNNFSGIEPELVRQLVRAPWLPQLVALDLMGNAIRDREAAVLARAASRFREDVSLTMSTDGMTESGKIALRGLDPRFGH